MKSRVPTRKGWTARRITEAGMMSGTSTLPYAPVRDIRDLWWRDAHPLRKHREP